jgi:hypothetical protein
VSEPEAGSADVRVLNVAYYAHGKRSQFGTVAHPQKGRFAVADIEIAGVQGNYAYSPLDFKYQAGGGATYGAAAGGELFGFDPSLGAGTLQPRQRTRGLVVFDVPKGPGRDIQVTDPVGHVLGEWKLS